MDGLWLVWRIKQSQLYALLAKLEAEGCIASTLHPQDAWPPRKVFKLTRTGRERYLAWVRSAVPHGRELRQDFFGKLYFALRLAFGRRGLLGGTLDAWGISIAFTTAAVVIAQTFIASPFYIKAASVAFAAVHRELQEAAALDGAITDSKNGEAAKKLFDYVLSPEAQSVLAKYGFIPVTGNSSGGAPGFAFDSVARGCE